MGTEVKLKREAIERRIAELEGKMPDTEARFLFDGVFEIRAHTRKEAVQMAKIGCGMNIGEIHTCYGTDVDWEFDCKPDKIVK